MHDRQVSRLSGGERGRLSLLRLIKEGHNTLLLDEPTNHLDIRSRESLEAALAEFTGTMVVVSHDRRFLDKIVRRLIVFGDGDAPRLFDGNYADYVWKRKQEHQEAVAVAKAPASTGRTSAPTPPKTTAGLSKNEIGRRRQWIAEAEEKILALETERDEALTEMGAPDLQNERRVVLAKRCTEIDMELEAVYADWEKWGLEIEEGTENTE